MAKKVLVVVDVQNDFVKGGVLAYGFPEQDNTGAIEKTVEQALANGDWVLATQDTHNDDYLNTLEGKKLPVPHCIRDTKGYELVSWLNKLVAEDRVWACRKNTFGCKNLPRLIYNLTDYNGIEEIRVCGYCTSICVLANAAIIRAAFPNTKITVLKDLCGDIDEESHLAALKVMQNQQIDIE